MARKIHARYRITGRLTAVTPLHVGGYGESADTDMPLARNGAGDLYIPGTSLAGVLRAWYTLAFGDNAADALWGFQEPEATPQANKRQHRFSQDVLWGFQKPAMTGQTVTGQASFVLVDDAPVQIPMGAHVEIRDGVGIDRVWGSAAESIKYDRAVLPSGTSLPLGLTVDIAGRRRAPDESQSESPEAFVERVQRTKAMLGHLLAALDKRHLAFGAARTRGLGRVVCTLERVLHQQLDSRAGIFAVLQRHGTEESVQKLCDAAPGTRPQGQPRFDIAIRWQPHGPLMVKAGYEGVGVDIVPLVSATAGGMALVLPGSSIKGALRSQAERIVRTVLGRRASAPLQARQRFLTQLEEVPLIRELFGSRAQAQDPNAPAPAPRDTRPLPGLGALAAEDCYACDTISPEHWRVVTAASAAPDQSYEQQELWKALKTLERVSSGRYTVTQHVAIDRWTGGAADGMLFSILAPEHIVWHDLCLRLDLGRLPEALRLPGLMLLMLTLRDLLQHRLPLGFATNRGMGEVEVADIHLQGADLDALDLGSLTDIRLSDPGLHTLEAPVRERLTTAWQTWITDEARKG